MELNGVELDPILTSRIEQWMVEITEIRAMYDEVEASDERIGHFNPSSYYAADERSSFANEDAREILEWLLAEIGLWPEEEGAPNDQADPALGG